MFSEYWIFIVVFVVILGVLVTLRSKNSNLEIKTTDIILALFPLVIYLLHSGKIEELSFGDLTIKTAFVEASSSKIEPQVAPLMGMPSRKIKMDLKRGVDEIPRLIENKTEGLKFHIGYSGYYGPAIKQYIVKLGKHPYLKYLIFENPDGTFFGLSNAWKFYNSVLNKSKKVSPAKLAKWLREADRDSIKTMPGFISKDQAVHSMSDKGKVLQRMENMNMDILPSLNEKDEFQGVVDRSRLTASLIIDVTNRLKQK